jgi:DNA-binding transcriptional MerR regulator
MPSHRVTDRPGPDELVPPSYVADRLGVDVKTVGRYAVRGVLPFQSTAGGHRRYRVRDVEELARTLTTLDTDTATGDEALAALHYVRDVARRYAESTVPRSVEESRRDGEAVLERVLRGLKARRRIAAAQDRTARDLFAHLRAELESWARTPLPWHAADGTLIPVEQARSNAVALLAAVDQVDPEGCTPEARARAEHELAEVRRALGVARQVTDRILGGEELPYAEVRVLAVEVKAALDLLDPPEALDPSPRLAAVGA